MKSDTTKEINSGHDTTERTSSGKDTIQGISSEKVYQKKKWKTTQEKKSR